MAAAPEQIARDLFTAYGAGDLNRVRSLLADDLVSRITNADGGTDRVEGADGFMARLPDTSEADLATEVTQIVGVDDELAMTMVEVRAERRGRTLHNFAGFLTRVAGGRITELWMVDAKPAPSDDFWS
ncbi:MAG TPA: nuclear transport factor 2 family protein [Acidimicrobiia bacterium]|jgi:ketosteroid isomerase-like protein|nr:nuclear transport factor 2 family protein [Acidimicrobiia bacterium]